MIRSHKNQHRNELHRQYYATHFNNSKIGETTKISSYSGSPVIIRKDSGKRWTDNDMIGFLEWTVLRGYKQSEIGMWYKDKKVKLCYKLYESFELLEMYEEEQK
jgi:hypothetical protein